MTDTAPIHRLPAGIIPEQVAVRVRNTGTERLKLRYANQTYMFEPGQDVIAGYQAMCYWFGDPRSVNIGDKRNTQYRDREVDRLSVLYGVYAEPFAVDVDGMETEPVRVDDHRTLPARPYVNRRHPNLPSVEVYDLTTNERILTVIDDPAGDNNAPPSNSRMETAALEDQMRAMQTQMNAMAAQLAQTNPEAAQQFVPGAAAPPTSTDAILANLEDDSTDALADPEPDPADRPTVDGTSSVPKTKPRTQ